MFRIPSFLEVPAAQRTRGELAMRFEDVTQVGRVNLMSLPSAGAVVWRNLLERHPIYEGIRRGVVPILCRLAVASEPARVRVAPAFEVEGGFALAHTLGEDGAVERILLDLFAEVRFEGAGVGRYRAEHVFTRPFGAPEERKVRRFDLPGLEGIPGECRDWRPLESAAELPEGAVALDSGVIPDDGVILLGLDDTDSNRHVNSLVYPNLFREAALRRLACHAPVRSLQAVELEASFRKPHFAGDRIRFAARAFHVGERLGAAGTYSAEGEPRPSGWLSIVFERNL